MVWVDGDNVIEFVFDQLDIDVGWVDINQLLDLVIEILVNYCVSVVVQQYVSDQCFLEYQCSDYG